ncbi:hypothetical protein [Azospirillum argentinense]|uniref:hypothetical protein n=1 Tax=Azospirillum argentinense TaxID=2970906 RepID=UPI0010BF8FE3|nr:hypothetical protein [Azospirillum argentinense]
MKAISVIVASAFSLMVGACAQPAWIYNGKRYEDGELMRRDMAAVNDSYLAQLKPLNKPVTQRELKVFIPERSYFMDAKLSYLKVGFPTATMNDIEKGYLATTNYDENSNLWRRIEKKGIFPKVTYSYVGGASGIQPTDEYDVFVFSVATQPPAIDQWYYISKRNGRQAIHFDVNLTDIYARADSQLDAIKAAAMQ